MSLDTIITIACLIGLAITYPLYLYFSNNVKLKYKVQKVGR
jgi:hypothetical protein